MPSYTPTSVGNNIRKPEGFVIKIEIDSIPDAPVDLSCIVLLRMNCSSKNFIADHDHPNVESFTDFSSDQFKGDTRWTVKFCGGCEGIQGFRKMTSEREVLPPPPPPAPRQSGIVDRVPGPVVVLLWSSLVAGGYLWAGLKGLAFTGAIPLIVLLPARWRPIVDRVPGPVVVLLWSSLVVGAYLWTGLKGLAFTGGIALIMAGMVALRRRWRPKGPPKTWLIFLVCWAMWMYAGTGGEWLLTYPAVLALATLTTCRYLAAEDCPPPIRD